MNIRIEQMIVALDRLIEIIPATLMMLFVAHCSERDGQEQQREHDAHRGRSRATAAVSSTHFDQICATVREMSQRKPNAD